MTDYLLNNVRELLSGTTGEAVRANFNVHNVTDEAAVEIVSHCRDGWRWTAESSGSESSQWLNGVHRPSGTNIILFLAAERRERDTTSRGKSILSEATPDVEL